MAILLLNYDIHHGNITSNNANEEIYVSIT